MRTPNGFELPRVITPQLCATVGLSRSRVRTELRRGAWRLLAHGVVLTRPDTPTRLDWAEAGLLLGGPSAALSGWDALQLHGIRCTAEGCVLVLTREGRSRRVGPVLVRRTDRPYRARVTHSDHPIAPLFNLASASRAVADAALLARDIATVRAVVGRAVQRGCCDVASLAAELESCPRNGSAHLRTALAEVDEGARSAAEARVLSCLRRSRLPDFEPNVPVVDPSGQMCFSIDVFWRRYRAGLETDSRTFHFDVADWEATLDRHNVLTRGRLSLVHYSPAQLLTGCGRVAELEQWLRARAAEVGEPYLEGRPGRRSPRVAPQPFVLPA